MGDFHQNGVITTLHQIGNRKIEDIELELTEFSNQFPISLILPSLFSEFEKPAMHEIIDQLRKVPYLQQIIMGLDNASEREFQIVKEYMSQLPQHHRILWNDGPRMQKIIQLLEEQSLPIGERGKGLNVWLCLGYFLASAKSDVVAIHDCDIKTYDRNMLARLIFPVANPNFPFRFSKGYYYRLGENVMNGRVTRLLITPLIIALIKIFGNIGLLSYLQSFRYILSGEIAMSADLCRTIRLQSDWGLEVGMLFEIHRNLSQSRICQVDIAEAYDHKHQIISAENPSKGLSRMSFDIIKTLFNKLTAEGQVFNKSLIHSIKSTYYRIALDIVEQYYADSVINGLKTDRHKEESIVELFAKNIIRAGNEFMEKSLEIPYMPAWKRVISAIPSILEQFNELVELDNRL